MTRQQYITGIPLLVFVCIFLFSSERTFAAAPARAIPYTESKCSTDPNVFFCEDFEGQDIVNLGNNNCGSTWGNPAIENKDICWAGGGSHQRSTILLPGFDQSSNRVWRISKTTGFVDINTGINTGTGAGTIAGWLRPNILGTGAQDWYARGQIYIDQSQNFPPDIDYKIGIWALPRQFVDPPSAQYENGLYFHQDFYCSVSGTFTSFNDVLLMRYAGSYASKPDAGATPYCPPSAVGAVANNQNAVRFAKGRWYTVEAHYRLGGGSGSSGSGSGLMEMWIDGNLAYRFNNVNTCGGSNCPDMGYIMLMGYMNGGDVQQGFTELDNVIYSRSYEPI